MTSNRVAIVGEFIIFNAIWMWIGWQLILEAAAK